MKYQVSEFLWVNVIFWFYSVAVATVCLSFISVSSILMSTSLVFEARSNENLVKGFMHDFVPTTMDHDE